MGDARGIGCLWALELVRNKDSKEMLVPFNSPTEKSSPMKLLENECLKNGVSILTASNRLFVCPPLNSSDKDVAFGLEVIDEALLALDKFTH